MDTDIRNPRSLHGPVGIPLEPWEVKDFRDGTAQNDPDHPLSQIVRLLQGWLDPIFWAIVLILALLIWPILIAFGLDP